MAIIFAVFFLLLVINFAGEGMVHHNLQQENKRCFEEACRNYDAWHRQTSQESDVFYNVDARCLNFNYYSDGSLKKDPYNNRTYQKGEYRCDSRGRTATLKQASPDVKRPPM